VSQDKESGQYFAVRFPDEWRYLFMRAKEWTKEDYLKQIDLERAHWNDLYENGCADPFWEDGCNLNLIRNHIIYYYRKIEELAEQKYQANTQISLFDMPEPELKKEIPQEVSMTYMAPNQRYPDRFILRTMREQPA
jgi:hypothetical protein